MSASELVVCRSFGPTAIVLCLIGGVAVHAAWWDVRTLCIPNRFVLTSLGLVAAGVVVRVLVNGEPAALVVQNVALGWLLSGAGFMALLWLLRPALVGGGDWKFLGALGAGIGLIVPSAAGSVLLVAAPVGAVLRLVRRRRRAVPMGPGLAAGYLVALVVARVWSSVVGVST